MRNERYGHRGWYTAAILLGSFLLSTAGVAMAKDTMLTYAPPQKKSLQYKMAVTQDMNVQGMEITVNQSADVEVAYLGETDEGNSQISVSFSNFENNLMQDGNLIKQEPELDGKTLHAFVSSRGEVVKVEPQSDLSDEVSETAEGLVENLFAYLPEKKVKTGDAWTQKLHEKSKSKETDEPEIDGEIEYTLDDIRKIDGMQVAKILGEGTIKIHAVTPAGVFKGEAEGKTELTVAVDGGYLLECESSAKINGQVGEAIDVDRVERFSCKLQKD